MQEDYMKAMGVSEITEENCTEAAKILGEDIVGFGVIEGTIDEPQFEDESIAEIDHMRKLAGVMSQTPKAKKKENIHKTTPRSIHKRQK
jgi:hypothetical protein